MQLVEVVKLTRQRNEARVHTATVFIKHYPWYAAPLRGCKNALIEENSPLPLRYIDATRLESTSRWHLIAVTYDDNLSRSSYQS